MKLVIIYKRKKYKLEYTLKRRPDNKGYSRPRFIPKEADIYILSDLIRDKKYSEKRYSNLSDFNIDKKIGGTGYTTRTRSSAKETTEEIPEYKKNIKKNFDEEKPYACIKFESDDEIYKINIETENKNDVTTVNNIGFELYYKLKNFKYPNLLMSYFKGSVTSRGGSKYVNNIYEVGKSITNFIWSNNCDEEQEYVQQPQTNEKPKSNPREKKDFREFIFNHITYKLNDGVSIINTNKVLLYNGYITRIFNTEIDERIHINIKKNTNRIIINERTDTITFNNNIFLDSQDTEITIEKNGCNLHDYKENTNFDDEILKKFLTGDKKIFKNKKNKNEINEILRNEYVILYNYNGYNYETTKITNVINYRDISGNIEPILCVDNKLLNEPSITVKHNHPFTIGEFEDSKINNYKLFDFPLFISKYVPYRENIQQNFEWTIIPINVDKENLLTSLEEIFNFDTDKQLKDISKECHEDFNILINNVGGLIEYNNILKSDSNKDFNDKTYKVDNIKNKLTKDYKELFKNNTDKSGTGISSCSLYNIMFDTDIVSKNNTNNTNNYILTPAKIIDSSSNIDIPKCRIITNKKINTINISGNNYNIYYQCSTKQITGSFHMFVLTPSIQNYNNRIIIDVNKEDVIFLVVREQNPGENDTFLKYLYINTNNAATPTIYNNKIFYNKNKCITSNYVNNLKNIYNSDILYDWKRIGDMFQLEFAKKINEIQEEINEIKEKKPYYIRTIDHGIAYMSLKFKYSCVLFAYRFKNLGQGIHPEFLIKNGDIIKAPEQCIRPYLQQQSSHQNNQQSRQQNNQQSRQQSSQQSSLQSSLQNNQQSSLQNNHQSSQQSIQQNAQQNTQQQQQQNNQMQNRRQQNALQQNNNMHNQQPPTTIASSSRQQLQPQNRNENSRQNKQMQIQQPPTIIASSSRQPQNQIMTTQYLPIISKKRSLNNLLTSNATGILRKAQKRAKERKNRFEKRKQQIEQIRLRSNLTDEQKLEKIREIQNEAYQSQLQANNNS